MTSSLKFDNHQLELLPEKAIWVQDLNSIYTADLHFGKAAHFRKSGIPIPEQIHNHDLELIRYLIERYKPLDFYFLGDLFHSDWNEQWDYLNLFLEEFENTTFHLVKGNHDILSPTAYQKSSFTIHSEPIAIGKLLLSHEPIDLIPEGYLNLCGHIHPGIKLVGKGRQSIRIPCFHLRLNQLILPAFGEFTGLALIKPKYGDQIFGVTGKKIIQIL
jgi:DNA ligase-associated metallophosphoesterase